MSSEERSGFRDQALSERHRHWGKNLPMMDIDTVWVEYDSRRPVCLIEYKVAGAPRNEVQKEVLARLADMARLPAFVVRYRCEAESDDWRFRVWPLNDAARTHLATETAVIGEESFVQFLYAVRDRTMPGYLREWFQRPFDAEWDALALPKDEAEWESMKVGLASGP